MRTAPLAAALAVALAASPALAECPGALTVGEAFVLSRGDGFTERVERTGADTLRVERWIAGREGPPDVVTDYAHGYHAVRLERDGRFLAPTINAPDGALPPPDVPGIVIAQSFALDLDGETRAGELTDAMVGEEEYDLGGCAYRVRVIRSRTDLGDGPPTTFEKLFSPALGYVVGAIRLDGNDEAVSAVLFERIAGE